MGIFLAWYMFFASLTITNYSQQYDPGEFWKHDLSTTINMDSSGTVSIFCGTVIGNPCPNFGVITCCTRVQNGGSTWITTARNTSGYHHITLDFYMNPVDLDSDEYCKIYYSIDDSFDWIEIAKYGDVSTFQGTIELPQNASDNSLGIRLMFGRDSSSGVLLYGCYLNSGYLYGTAITNDPTTNPTIFPTIDPTSNPTVDPTIQPTTSTNNPTFNPTNIPSDTPTYNPTYDPSTYPSAIPTMTPSKYPTTKPTNTPTQAPYISSVIVDTTSVTESVTSAAINDNKDTRIFLDEIVIILLSVLIILIICSAICFLLYYRKRRKTPNERGKTNSDGDMEQMTRVTSVSANTTNAFQQENELGLNTDTNSVKSFKSLLANQHGSNMIVASSVALSVVNNEQNDINKKEEFYCRAIGDYNGTEKDQLSLNNGGIYIIMQTTKSGWWYAINENGDDGWVPSNYLKKCDDSQQKELKKQYKLQIANGDDKSEYKYKTMGDMAILQMYPRVPPITDVPVQTHGEMQDDDEDDDDEDYDDGNTTHGAVQGVPMYTVI